MLKKQDGVTQHGSRAKVATFCSGLDFGRRHIGKTPNYLFIVKTIS